jgi:hypothetical protein
LTQSVSGLSRSSTKLKCSFSSGSDGN